MFRRQRARDLLRQNLSAPLFFDVTDDVPVKERAVIAQTGATMGSMKDARWQRAIDEAEKIHLDFHGLDYPAKVRMLNQAQRYLDEHPEKVEPLAKRFNQPEEVEESSTAFAIRAAKAEGVRAAMVHARSRVDPSSSADAFSRAVDEYLSDLERPIRTPSRFSA